MSPEGVGEVDLEILVGELQMRLRMSSREIRESPCRRLVAAMGVPCHRLARTSYDTGSCLSRSAEVVMTVPPGPDAAVMMVLPSPEAVVILVCQSAIRPSPLAGWVTMVLRVPALLLQPLS